MNLITPAELAEQLGISPQTLSIWRLRGGKGPPFLKVGSRVMYRREAVEAWLATRERASTSDTGEGARTSAA